MHVLHRPHLPRLISVSIAAAVLAIAISLALASDLSNISQPANGTTLSTHRAAPASTGARHATTPEWMGDPFAPLGGPLMPPPWPTARH